AGVALFEAVVVLATDGAPWEVPAPAVVAPLAPCVPPEFWVTGAVTSTPWIWSRLVSDPEIWIGMVAAPSFTEPTDWTRVACWRAGAGEPGRRAQELRERCPGPSRASGGQPWCLSHPCRSRSPRRRPSSRWS